MLETRPSEIQALKMGQETLNGAVVDVRYNPPHIGRGKTRRGIHAGDINVAVRLICTVFETLPTFNATGRDSIMKAFIYLTGRKALGSECPPHLACLHADRPGHAREGREGRGRRRFVLVNF